MYDEFLKHIIENNKIIILRHVLPDGDAYGFQFGLKKLINLNWPDKKVLISGHKNKDLDYIGSEFDEISDKDFKESLVIVGDTANTARIDEPRWNLGKFIIKFDHHIQREVYGNIQIIKEGYVATCEILTEFIKEKKLKIDKEIARILYHGIVTDSMRFMLRFPQPRTFYLAGWLLETGFDLEELYATMYKTEVNDLRFISYVYENFKITKNGVAYIFLDKSVLDKFKIDGNVAYEKVHLLANINNCPIYCIFSEYPDRELKIRCELRSNKIKISDIAEKYNGGGHSTSAGAFVKDFEVALDIVNDLDKLI